MKGGDIEAQKHSGIGIASFITSIVAEISTFLLLGIAGVMEASTPGGMDEKSVGAVIVGLLIFVFLFASLAALGLGIAGLVQKDRKKVFPVLGTVFPSVTILVTLFIMILGLTCE